MPFAHQANFHKGDDYKNDHTQGVLQIDSVRPWAAETKVYEITQTAATSVRAFVPSTEKVAPGSWADHALTTGFFLQFIVLLTLNDLFVETVDGFLLELTLGICQLDIFVLFFLVPCLRLK